MQIRFADRRPEGDYALVLPVAGKDRKTLSSLGDEQQGASAALDRQRFEGEPSSTAEAYYSDNGSVRRLVAVGTGAATAREGAEKLGGAVAAKLLTSGDSKAVIDLTG